MPTPAATPFPTLVPSSPLGVILEDATLDAALARCPTPAEIALVDAVLTMTFEYDPTAPTLVCTAAGGSADLTRLEERAYQAVLSMRRIPFDVPLPWTELSLFDWFGRAVSGIIYRSTDVSFCCDGPGRIVIKSDRMSSLESPLWVARDGTGFGLMSHVQLLIHEARHAEGWLHTCANGDDQTLEEMGSWALVYWFYRWLAEHASGPYMTPVDAPADLYTSEAAKWVVWIPQYWIGCSVDVGL